MPSIGLAQPAETRHADVSTKLRAAIAAGKYVPGCLLPTEHELAQMHGVSRQTIRTALQALESRGYISRKKGVGTRVESAQPAGAFSHAFDSLEDLVRIASLEVRRIDRIDPVELDRALARRLEAPPGSRWICFSGQRFASTGAQRPVCLTRIFVDARFAAVANAVRDEPTALIATLLERECGQAIEEVHQQVAAVALEDAAACALAVAPGSAGLHILRHYKSDPRTILEITETVYPADRVSVSTHLRRRPRDRSVR